MSEAPPTDLAARPAPEAARRVVLTQLRRAEDAASRLGAADDPEALHDFRVAVRRLRSLLRSHREVLDGAAKPRTLRRLRRVARSTNDGRDAEVQAAWVRAHLLDGDTTPYARRAARWLGDWLDARATASAGAIETVRRRFARCSAALARDLGTYRVDLERVPPTFGSWSARILREDMDRLRRRLLAHREEPSSERAHRARLAAKRLRYDLEPSAAEAAATVADLKRLQDILGELNDAGVFLSALEEAAVAAAEERARSSFGAALADGTSASGVRRRHPASGLLSLVDAARSRQDAAESKLRKWLEDGSPDALWRAVEGVASSLEAAGTP